MVIFLDRRPNFWMTQHGVILSGEIADFGGLHGEKVERLKLEVEATPCVHFGMSFRVFLELNIISDLTLLFSGT